MMIKVIEGQDPYNVIGKYIRDHITVIEDIIAVIKINEVETNQLFMVDGDMNKGNYFIWENDWWEGEKDITLIDFFPVSEAQRANQGVDTISRQAAIEAICAVCGNDCDKSEFLYNAPQDEQIILCPEHYVLTQLPSTSPDFNTIVKIDKAYDDGYECGYLQAKNDYEVDMNLLSEPELLTDKEQRIFLAAMDREEKICKLVDEDYNVHGEPHKVSLVRICHEITRKVKGALWS